jgi:hypothetical protein
VFIIKLSNNAGSVSIVGTAQPIKKKHHLANNCENYINLIHLKVNFYKGLGHAPPLCTTLQQKL